ncbi:5-bromo-4-chloroindolyl phosphate hydrolysis family protein [Thioclava sp. GXIMD4216]|uniref:5-bromo-4-chloroindolyl phosphate hydrolysis family protein n=1 Tax=Thioclava litoralis TaxID=3076557 RepID=A0ABZ1DZJ7_9RHOB|nr:5-bromo-4-chloroindolyl phosphate hydrolysis family protein [Thioclava sp. FTW29]
MARRFSGKYSPEAPHHPDRLNGQEDIPTERLPRPEHPYEGRPFWVAICALPFLFGAFGAGPVALARAIMAFGLCAGAAFLIREGLRAQAAYEARRVARRPALPRKILGAMGIGLGLALGAQEMGLLGALGSGLIGTALGIVAFGLDPLKNKGMDGIDPFQQERAAEAVAIGEEHLAAMRAAIARAHAPQLEARVEMFATRARDLFRAVEEDPNDLRAARRYLTLYLEGARDATIRFADLYAQSPDPAARSRYESLLDDLERNFTAKSRQLIESGREGLEIEIDVLRERLERDGIAPTFSRHHD